LTGSGKWGGTLKRLIMRDEDKKGQGTEKISDWETYPQKRLRKAVKKP